MINAGAKSPVQNSEFKVELLAPNFAIPPPVNTPPIFFQRPLPGTVRPVLGRRKACAGNSRGRGRGSVLLIVLVTLMFTSFALVLFIEQASTDLLVESRDITARRLRRDAYSALEATLATLEDFRRVGNGLHSPAEGWGDPLGFSGWQPREGTTADVTLEDESAKIPLAHVDSATLINLFKGWNFQQSDAERLTDALLGWMRSDYVPASAESPDYDQGDVPFLAPARPMRSFAELASIDYARTVFFDDKGRPNDLWFRFVGTFSIFNYQQINLNSVTPDILTAMGFSDPTQYQRLHDYLAGNGQYSSQGAVWLTSTRQAAALMGTGTLPRTVGVLVRALRVNITVREGKNEFRLSAVVAPTGSGASTVQTTATSKRASASGNSATSPGATTVNSGVAAPAPPTTPPPQLNYPFTLLEIKENAEIPPSSPPPPPAPPA
jgi:general secretion pathway protein K